MAGEVDEFADAEVWDEALLDQEAHWGFEVEDGLDRLEEHIAGGYALAVDLGDLSEGETLDERNARLLARNEEQRGEDRPGGKKSDPPPVPRPVRAKLRGTSRARYYTSAVAITRDGVLELTDLGGDVDAIGSFLGAAAKSRGLSLANLLRPARAGKPNPAEKARRDALASLVAEARARGAKVEALAEVTGRSIATVSTLAADGRRALQ